MAHSHAVRGKKLNAQLKCWFYLNPKDLPEINLAFAEHIRKILPTCPRWEITPIQDWKKARSQDDMLFVPLHIDFTTGRSCAKHVCECKPDLELFDDLWNNLVGIVLQAKFKRTIGVQGSNMIFFALCNTKSDSDFAMKRYLLPKPVATAKYPAEIIELEIMKLVDVNICQKRARHAGCSGVAAVSCIENELYFQKVMFEKLCQELCGLLQTRALLGHEGFQGHGGIHLAIRYMEGLDKALGNLVDLFVANVGQAPAVQGKFKFTRYLKTMFRNKMGSIPIDKVEVEIMKKRVQLSLGRLRGMTTVVAGHIRLLEPSCWMHIARVLEATPDGPEKYELPSKLCLRPSHMHDAEYRHDVLQSAVRLYHSYYVQIIADINLLNKACDMAFARAEMGDTRCHNHHDHHGFHDEKVRTEQKAEYSGKGQMSRHSRSGSCFGQQKPKSTTCRMSDTVMPVVRALDSRSHKEH